MSLKQTPPWWFTKQLRSLHPYHMITMYEQMLTGLKREKFLIVTDRKANLKGEKSARQWWCTTFMNCLIPMFPQFCQAACHEPGKGVPLDGRRNKVLGWLALRHWVTPPCFINSTHASVSRPVTRFSKDLICFQRELWLNRALPIYERKICISYHNPGILHSMNS